MIKKISILCVLIAVTACACSKSKQSAGASADPTAIVATIDDVKITASELDEAAKNRLSRIDQEIYEVKRAVLDEMIKEKLIESAAKKQNKSVEEFIKESIDDKATPPTDDEIKKFYEARKEQMGGKKFDEVKGQIKGFLMQSKRQALQQQLFGGLRAGSKVKVELSAPRVEIEAGDNPSIGPKNAPITIIEFTDFQCPFCSRVRATINQITDEYKDKVRYVLRDFPLSFHQFAKKAHEAAHCAGDQGKYWDYTSEIWKNQQALQIEKLKEYAKVIKLDVKKFDQCLDSGKYTKKVEENVAAGADAGAQGTPSFFINGIFLSGARPVSDFKNIIDQELNK